MPPIFDKFEFDARHDRARTLMAERNLAALLAYAPGNQFWLTGYRGGGGPQSIAAFVQSMTSPRIVLPLEGEPALLGLRSAADAYALETHVTDIRPMISPPSEAPKLIRSILAERGIGSGRIGIDRATPGGIGEVECGRLSAELSGYELVDATALFTSLRMIKTPAEIACLRRAVEIQNAAFALFLGRASRRMSDRDIRWELQKAQMEAGASELGLVLLAGHPATALFGAPSEQPAPERGLRWLDSGANYSGYTCDFDMIVAWGEPDAELIATHNRLRDAYDEAMEAWRPGRAIVDIARDTLAALSRHGLGDRLGGAFLGHSLGSEVVERPWFGARAPADLVLQPNMVIAPEWLNVTPLGDLLWEENFLVTETGLDRLSAHPAAIPVIAD